MIKREFARHIAYPATHLAHLLYHIEAVNACHSRLWQQQRAENAEHRCLAGAVRTDEAEHLALGDSKRHIAECLHLAVALADVLYINGIHHSQFSIFN